MIVDLGIERFTCCRLLIGHEVTEVIIGVLNLGDQTVAALLVEVGLAEGGKCREENLDVIVMGTDCTYGFTSILTSMSL